jgi:phosphoenolpyruvate phosphomutase
MPKEAKRLRELFAEGRVVRIIGAHNAFGAKLAERAGFDAIWSSGFEISTSYAVPDANILTMSEFLAAAQSMAEASRLPVIADCDTGFGNSNNVIHLVHKFEAAGVAAICIEDKLFPKVNSFIPGRQELASVAEFVGKLLAAKNAQRTPDFMIVARVEALIAGHGLTEAQHRARAYANAGADAILIHSKESSPDEIVEFARAWDLKVPLIVVPTTYPEITVAQLGELGIGAVIYANHGLRASAKAMSEVYAEILESGSTATIEARIAPMSLLFEIQGMPQFKKCEEMFLGVSEKATRAIIPAAGDHLAEYSMTHIASDTPMTMLDINGKPLLRRQTDVLKSAGVNDVTVVGGHKRERISVDGVALIENPQWATTGEMASLMCVDGRRAFGGCTLVAYSDILFDLNLCRRLLECEDEIVIVADRSYDPARYNPARKRIDLVALADRSGAHARRALNGSHLKKVRSIGKSLDPLETSCEFCGLALFSAKGWQMFVDTYKLVNGSSPGRFHEAPSATQASLTDMLQELIDRGQDVSCLEISEGWMEIHSFEDYRLACRLTADQ